MIEFRTFVEVKTTDGYGNQFWKEICLQNGFLDGYCAGFNQYITEELYIGLMTIRDGYYSKMFKRPVPNDLSTSVRYKLDMLATLGNVSFYHLYLGEIQSFNWNKQIYGSLFTTPTTYINVAPDFVTYYLPSLEALGPPDKVRLSIIKIG